MAVYTFPPVGNVYTDTDLLKNALLGGFREPRWELPKTPPKIIFERICGRIHISARRTCVYGHGFAQKGSFGGGFVSSCRCSRNPPKRAFLSEPVAVYTFPPGRNLYTATDLLKNDPFGVFGTGFPKTPRKRLFERIRGRIHISAGRKCVYGHGFAQKGLFNVVVLVVVVVGWWWWLGVVVVVVVVGWWWWWLGGGGCGDGGGWVDVFVRKYVYTYMNISLRIHICMYIYIYICVCVFVCVCVCVYVSSVLTCAKQGHLCLCICKEI